MISLALFLAAFAFLNLFLTILFVILKFVFHITLKIVIAAIPGVLLLLSIAALVFYL